MRACVLIRTTTAATVVVAALLLGPPVAASASVVPSFVPSIGFTVAPAGPRTAPPVLLSVGSTTVRVNRSPFALTVTDRSGRPVLRTTSFHDPIAPGATTVPPLGGDELPNVTRYAPLTYEVGGGASAAFPAGPFEGNLLTGVAAGAQYAATKVTRIRRDGAALVLTVATDDPTGRRVTLTLLPDGPNAARIRVRVSDPRGVDAVALSFDSPGDEAFHGFGGRHDSVDQHGRELVQYTQEENQGAGPGDGTVSTLPGTSGHTYLFPNGPTAAYYVQNSFVSSRHYGFLLDRPELSRFRLDSDRPHTWQVATGAAGTDLVVTAGGAQHDISALTALTGRHRLPPAWATGPTLYRGVRVLSTGSDTAATYEAKVRRDLREIDADHLDLTAYALEGWTLLSPSTLRDLIGELHARHLHVLLYLRAFAAKDVAGTESADVFTTALSHGYFTTTAAGTPYLFGSTFVAGVAGLLDFTNPATVRWWGRRVTAMLDLGADGFMQDFGEQTLADMHFHNGRTGVTMHNAYATPYVHATRLAFDRYRRTHPHRGCCYFFTRTGASGTHGSAGEEMSNFPGDETTDWSPSSGLASIVPDMLNRSVGGLYGFTTDIGGYLDTLSGAPSAELFTRWTEAAALTPFFRVHNSSGTGVRMPYDFDAATLRTYRQMARLHTRFEPYTRAAWIRARRTGVPVVRPLWLAAPEAPGARWNQDEWLLGREVLVAPVLTQDTRSRTVSFPRGCWQQAGHGHRIIGPIMRRIPAPLAVLPWFRRCR